MLNLGATWHLQWAVADEGIPANPTTFVVTIYDEAGTLTSGPTTITPGSTGDYGYDYTPPSVGWWRAKAVSSAGFVAIDNEAVYVTDHKFWKPNPAQVHALIPVRPLFTDTSRPTWDEVGAIIDMAAFSVAAESSSGDFPTSLAGKVQYVIALNAASQIEESFFPEQATGPDAPGQALYTRYQAELIGLRGLLKTIGGTASRVKSSRMGAGPSIPARAPYWDGQVTTTGRWV